MYARLALQVVFPAELPNLGPKTNAARQLRHVIECCLCPDVNARPTASKVAAALHKLMRQHSWSGDLTEQ